MNSPDKQPLVSVIIPCYNHGIYLSESIKSVFDQTHQNSEIIIVDAGSNDIDTKAILATLIDSRIKIISLPERTYPSEARNIAFKASSGAYLLTLDADDLIHKTFVEKMISALVSNPSAGAASSKVLYFGYEDGLLDYRGGMLEDNLINMGSHLCAVIRREAWESVMGFDENMIDGYEDWDFWIRLTRADWSIKIIKEVLFYYRQKETSRVTHVFENHEKIKAQIQAKHADVFANPYEYLKRKIGYPI